MGWINLLDLVITGMILYVLWDMVREILNRRRSEKKFYKENKHDKYQVLGLGTLLNDEDLTDFEKVKYIKDLLDIIDEEEDHARD